MGTAQALVAAAAVLVMSGGGRHLLEVFLPNQVLRIPVRGNPPLPPAVNVRVVGECANGQYDCAFLFTETLRPATLAEVQTCANQQRKYKNPYDLVWVIVIASLTGAVLSYGIGANGAANNWASTVGSGALGLLPSTLIGSVMVILGAALLGQGVAGTLRRGVSSLSDPDCWACGFCNSKMTLYMVGMMSASLAAAIFLILATIFALPVSTTHSIVGGVVGATVWANNWGCLNWSMNRGLSSIAASWIISPLLTGIVTCIIFFALRWVVFKRQDPARAAIIAVPVLYAASTLVLTYFIINQSPVARGLNPLWALGIAAVAGVVAGVLVLIFITPRMKKFMPSVVAQRKLEAAGSVAGAGPTIEGGAKLDEELGDPKLADQPEEVPKVQVETEGREGAITRLVKASMTASVSPKIIDRKNLEYKQHLEEAMTPGERDATWCFRYLLAFCATWSSFAFGANATPNAIATFTSVYQLFRIGEYACAQDPSSWYILTLGGVGVSIGMVTLGYKVIKTIGTDLTDINFFRGFCIEFSTTIVIVLASLLSIPISTTQAQLGAVIFIGIAAHGYKHVQWRLFSKIFVAWVLTLPVAGLMSTFFTWAFSHAVKEDQQ